MFFGRKNKNTTKCHNCQSSVSDKFSFCPHCGESLISAGDELKNFGMLGKNDVKEKDLINNNFMQPDFSITDKLIGSLMNSLMKNLDKQIKEAEKENIVENAEIKSFPNGIRIRIGPPIPINQQQSQVHKKHKNVIKKQLTEEQIQKMSRLPRAAAKSNVRRLSDKVVYELSTPGLENTDDVFISKLENGYEIKAIGSKKVYVNSLPVNLPLRSFSIAENKLLVEFKLHEEQQ